MGITNDRHAWIAILLNIIFPPASVWYTTHDREKVIMDLICLLVLVFGAHVYGFYQIWQRWYKNAEINKCSNGQDKGDKGKCDVEEGQDQAFERRKGREIWDAEKK